MAKSFFLSLILIATVVLSTPTSANATAAAPVCPARGEITTRNLSIHPKLGEGVFVSERSTFAMAGCRASNRSLVNSLCLTCISGDIAISEVKSGTSLAAAQK